MVGWVFLCSYKLNKNCSNGFKNKNQFSNTGIICFFFLNFNFPLNETSYECVIQQ